MNSSIDHEEISKFAKLSEVWWDQAGALKTLHDINPARLQFIQQDLNLADKKVLDVGCGGGILSEAMAKLGAKVTAIDAEASAIDAAIAHAQKNQLDIDYHCMPIEDYDTEGFDMITCMELLEHVRQPELILRHCKRCLKPGGSLFLSTINRTAKAYLHAVIAAEYLLGLLPKQTHDYDKLIKPSELYAIARSLDLKLVGMSGMGYNPFTRQSWLCQDLSVNYFMSLRRSNES